MRVTSLSLWPGVHAAALAALKDRPRARLVAGTVVVLLGLIRLLAVPQPDLESPEHGRSTLSHYVVDTDFLMRCARRHPCAMQASHAVSPEVRLAILELALREED
jgi:hypothetical protein